MRQYCTQCGTKNTDDAAFCSECGQALQEKVKSTYATTNNTAASSTASIGNKIFKIVLALIAIFFIFTLSTVAIALATDDIVKPIALLVASMVSIFVFKKIVNS